ncbi:type IV pilus assembly protein PilM [Halonatronum saccharophilum]|uniref:type IV pilus assembly protein PilM n=1 Tax=Halonatronum saccharophilum TaxID=150060 RepID=UPI0004B0B1A6|nr:type IV pilus assembly protein PilM [Halonatronum saccharophilum]
MKKLMKGIGNWLDNFKETSVIGLDIGEDTIKLTEVDTGRGRIVLKGLSIVETPRGGVEDGKLKAPKMVAEILNPVFEENNFSTKQVTTAISGEEVITRAIEIPNIPKEELGEAVKWEASAQIPIPIEELILDYEILGRGEDGSYNILIIAVKKKLIDNYLKLFELLKLQGVAIEIEPIAIARTVGKLYETDTIGVIDMGTKTTDISILHKDQLLFTRTVGIGGIDITHDVADSFELRLEEAEEYKKENNLFEEGFTSLVLRSLTTDIYRSLDYFQVKNKGVDIKKIILTGGGSKLLGLDKHLSNEFGVNVEKLDLSNRLTSNLRSEEDLLQLAPFLGVSIGLALREEGIV